MENLEITPKKSSCLCGCSDYVVLACSGACDLGEPFEELKKNNILMLDGCPVDCGKKILDEAGFSDYKYLRITDLGYKCV